MKRFRFHKHTHTGRLLHHRHTHYPVLVLLVAVTGLLACLSTVSARADDMLVSATVPAPIPADPPVIIFPSENAVVSDPTVDFRGTCPVTTPPVIIGLYEGSDLRGSANCDSTGRFSIRAVFTPGSHIVIATIHTITGDTGRSSQPLHFSYEVPATSTPPAPSPAPEVTAPPIEKPDTVQPLEITSQQVFVSYSKGLAAEWRGRFSGGIAPYTITAVWGDGSSNTSIVDDADIQSFSHKYASSFRRDTTLSVTVTDSAGSSLTRYFAVRYTGPAITSTTRNNPLVSSIIFIEPLNAMVMVYLCLLLTMLLVWRYEHIHYPRVLGVALHYQWQRAHHSKKHS